jgi:nicotinate-nucleotide--dimethylbenzimidazole phosphoribosyltransferase
VADLLEISAGIRASDPAAAAAARSAVPADGGRLALLAGWLAATTGSRPFQDVPVRLIHHPAARAEVAGSAARAGVPLRLLDPSAGDPIDAGVAAADREIDEGAGLLLLAVADPAPTAAAVLVALVTGAEPVALLPRGPAAVDSAAWVARATELRDRRRHVLELRHQPARLLAELDAPVLAAMVGFVLRCAARRTPLLLDGTAAVAAALFAADLHTRAADWWQVADTFPDPVQQRVLSRLGQRPVLDLEANSGSGTSALLALPALHAAAALTRPEPADA